MASVEPRDRKPNEIVLNLSELLTEFKCPICLNTLRDAMVTKECLHRFCRVCIITALRVGNKECPACREKLASKRSLRPDHQFNSLTTMLFANRIECEAEKPHQHQQN